jgi:5-methylthioadenosine/S-adenosylhomocysteine deaminase
MTTQIIWGGTLLTGFDVAGEPVILRDAGIV